MISFSFLRLTAPASRLAAAVAGALLCASAPLAAQDAANPNVIVDDSALDSAGVGGGSELLPAPAQKPISRLVTSGESAVELSTPPEATSDSTFAAVPTTPIEATDLNGDGLTSETADTAPAAGVETPAGTAPADATADSATDSAPATEAQTTPEDPESAPDQQTAFVPPIDGMVRLTFEPGSRAITDADKTALGPLIEKLNTDYALRVQVLAYAGGDEDASTQARGVSLARALVLRDYLSGQGIAMDRMDLKALGNSAQEEPADRVDLVPLAQ
jgi:outer membrane protein OmpA-like peptidoglycan-associated protein